MNNMSNIEKAKKHYSKLRCGKLKSRGNYSECLTCGVRVMEADSIRNMLIRAGKIKGNEVFKY
ncbi:MAG: hypothetical protein ACE5ES_01785 [Candidatus Nanoarchaeia archaeon]